MKKITFIAIVAICTICCGLAVSCTQECSKTEDQYYVKYEFTLNSDEDPEELRYISVTISPRKRESLLIKGDWVQEYGPYQLVQQSGNHTDLRQSIRYMLHRI